MKLLVHQVVSAASLNLLAYYHNETATGKDICDTHFAHMVATTARACDALAFIGLGTRLHVTCI